MKEREAGIEEKRGKRKEEEKGMGTLEGKLGKEPNYPLRKENKRT